MSPNDRRWQEGVLTAQVLTLIIPHAVAGSRLTRLCFIADISGLIDRAIAWAQVTHSIMSSYWEVFSPRVRKSNECISSFIIITYSESTVMGI